MSDIYIYQRWKLGEKWNKLVNDNESEIKLISKYSGLISTINKIKNDIGIPKLMSLIKIYKSNYFILYGFWDIFYLNFFFSLYYMILSWEHL